MSEREPLTHVAIGCGNVIKDVDRIIFIGDVSEVDCPACTTKLAEHAAQRARESAATAVTATTEALEALSYAKLGDKAPGSGRVDWNQVARDRLTEALDALAVT